MFIYLYILKRKFMRKSKNVKLNVFRHICVLPSLSVFHCVMSSPIYPSLPLKSKFWSIMWKHADQWTSSNNLSISLRIFSTISQNCLELVLKHLHSLLFECTPIFINVNYLESLFPSLSFCLRFTSCKFTSCEIYFMYFMSGECTICSTLFCQ